MKKSESNQAVANLMDWMRHEEAWSGAFQSALAEHIGPVLEAGGISQEELTNKIGPDAVGLMFGCIFEDLVTLHFEDAPHNIVDDYLKRRGWRDSTPCKSYMLALRDALISLYEVTDVSPGTWVEVRDLVRGGAPVRVFEHLGSKQMVSWDRLGARIVDHLGQKVFTGALLPFSTARSEEFIKLIEEQVTAEIIERGLKRSTAAPAQLDAATAAILSTMAPTFTATWLVEHIAKSSAPLPTLMNAEGDTLQFAETRFKLRHAAAAEVVSRLGELKELLRADETPPSWSWLGKISASSSKRPSEGLVMQTQDPSGAQVLGSLKLENGILQLSTNSVARMERGGEMLRAALGELIGAGLSDITSVQDALKKHRAAPAQQAHPESAIPPEVAAEIGRQFHDRHYRAWIDMRLPALDGLSPKQAVRTKHGRDEVVALLKQVENMEARSSRKSGQPPYDFGWLWQELGLAERRR